MITISIITERGRGVFQVIWNQGHQNQRIYVRWDIGCAAYLQLKRSPNTACLVGDDELDERHLAGSHPDDGRVEVVPARVRIQVALVVVRVPCADHREIRHLYLRRSPRRSRSGTFFLSFILSQLLLLKYFSNGCSHTCNVLQEKAKTVGKRVVNTNHAVKSIKDSAFYLLGIYY